MTKIDRRDYLKKMALGAAAIASSRLDTFGQKSRSQPRQPRTPEAQIATFDPLVEYFQNWPGTTVQPVANPSVLITFNGLLDFYSNAGEPPLPNAKTCGVGFHRGGGHHTPKISWYENGTLKPGWPITIRPNDVVRLGIVDAAGNEKPANVEFLKTRNGEPNDFRWLIDMQSRPWYQGVATKSNRYAARLFLRQGTYFTKIRTKHFLDRVIKIETLGVSHISRVPIGQPAQEVNAAINLAANEKVVLQLNGTNYDLPYDATKRYRLDFCNMCTDTTPNGPCHFKWRDYREVKRNDFHHHRDVLDLPGFSREYTVVISPGQSPPDQPLPDRHCLPEERHGKRGRVEKKSNDAAPCIGAGYGGGSGPS